MKYSALLLIAVSSSSYSMNADDPTQQNKPVEQVTLTKEFQILLERDVDALPELEPVHFDFEAQPASTDAEQKMDYPTRAAKVKAAVIDGHADSPAKEKPQYVTSPLSGGRFSDNMLSYMPAKWMAGTQAADYRRAEAVVQLLVKDEGVMRSLANEAYGAVATKAEHHFSGHNDTMSYPLREEQEIAQRQTATKKEQKEEGKE